MKNKIFLIIILVILIVGCIGVYYSNNEGMFVFNKDDNDKIIKIEKENKQLSLKELSNIVFTVEKSTKKSTDMSDLELIHAAVAISTKYIDTITGDEIKKIVKS